MVSYLSLNLVRQLLDLVYKTPWLTSIDLISHIFSCVRYCFLLNTFRAWLFRVFISIAHIKELLLFFSCVAVHSLLVSIRMICSIFSICSIPRSAIWLLVPAINTALWSPFVVSTPHGCIIFWRSLTLLTKLGCSSMADVVWHILLVSMVNTLHIHTTCTKIHTFICLLTPSCGSVEFLCINHSNLLVSLTQFFLPLLVLEVLKLFLKCLLCHFTFVFPDVIFNELINLLLCIHTIATCIGSQLNIFTRINWVNCLFFLISLLKIVFLCLRLRGVLRCIFQLRLHHSRRTRNLPGILLGQRHTLIQLVLKYPLLGIPGLWYRLRPPFLVPSTSSTYNPVLPPTLLRH